MSLESRTSQQGMTRRRLLRDIWHIGRAAVVIGPTGLAALRSCPGPSNSSPSERATQPPTITCETDQGTTYYRTFTSFSVPSKDMFGAGTSDAEKTFWTDLRTQVDAQRATLAPEGTHLEVAVGISGNTGRTQEEVMKEAAGYAQTAANRLGIDRIAADFSNNTVPGENGALTLFVFGMPDNPDPALNPEPQCRL